MGWWGLRSGCCAVSAAFPLELAAAALCPPPFNANVVGAPLAQTRIYSVASLGLC